VRFLDHLAVHGNVRAACALVGISAETAYRLRRRDFEFGEAWAAALVLARASAEQVLADRALNGVEEAIFYRGELVGTRLRFDGRLLLAHIARLDKLAEDTPAGTRASRFDELLALVAGEAFDAGMVDRAGDRVADRANDRDHEADPLLPMSRARYVAEVAARAARTGREDALDEIVEAAEAAGRVLCGRDDWRPEAGLDDGELEALDAAEDAAAEQGFARATAQWDDWRARARAVADGCEAVRASALDSVNSVNSVDRDPLDPPCVEEDAGEAHRHFSTCPSGYSLSPGRGAG
jgi:hypothetical protein